MRYSMLGTTKASFKKKNRADFPLPPGRRLFP